MEFNNEQAALNNIYQCAKTGSRTISGLMPKIENANFRTDLKTQDDAYRSIQTEAAKQLMQMGETPSDISPFKKAGMWANVNMSTLLKTDASHLAELMISGSTMGITNVTKVMNNYQNPNPQVADLANRFIQNEQGNIDRMKVHLR